MKFKYLFLSLILLVLACSIATIAAEEAIIDDYSFTIPDGYSIVNQSEQMVSMQIDNDHAIVMSAPDDVQSPKQFKTGLEKQGYKFGDEENYTKGNFDIEQYNYDYDKYQGFLYICDDNTDKDDDVILITLVIPKTDDVPSEDENPVTGILDSLKEVD
ncbi:hypothetical protein [Methanobrevibacter olleyae]|uniref:Uncharacterized protein n=1 Tax=Methanobrevibacter olleyae TaxID=294671 RepID=A0A126R2F1_METOL|nr:hypothetical protein [Methanobrevibacter olleyae]AMK16159.1 hypothetical protein YLM1_1604 [Methanobrevibacter olleyae]SFL31787.1 hypothetical protein SAMN02910297_00550 [Methanobrevibacter olleyae]